MKQFNPNLYRQDFPILQRKINGKPLVYLDNAATTQKPRQVIEAMVDYYENHNANPARSVHTLSIEATQMYEKAREKVAKFIGARTEEIVFVRNATEGLNLVAYSWGLANLKKGDVIITSVLEHHSNMLPWRMVSEKTGAEIKYVDVNEEGVILLGQGKTRTVVSESVRANSGGKSGFGIPLTQESGNMISDETSKVNQLPSSLFQKQDTSSCLGPLICLLDKRVKVVVLSMKSNMTGAIQPIKEAISLIKEKSPEAIIVLDGSHFVPHMATDVKKLGADFLAFSGHKMLGPMGIGVLWGRKELLEKMPPFLRGGDMISEVTLGGENWNAVPHKFEAGTPDVADAVGLSAAINYLEKIGIENIHQYEIELTKYALEKLKIESAGWRRKLKISLIGPRNAEQRSGVVTFNIEGVHAHDVAQILDYEGVAVRSGQHCTGPLMERLGIPASVRASFYFYNTKEDVDRLIEALKKVPKIFKL